MSAVFDNTGRASSLAASPGTPVIVSACVNQMTVTVSWTDASPAPSTAYYTVTLDSADKKYSINFPDQSVKLARTASQALSGQDYPPDLSQVFTATVAAYDDQGNQTGPTSAQFEVALTAPVVTSVRVSGELVTVTWNNAFQMPGLASYVATINCAQDPNFSLNGPSVSPMGAPTCTFATGALDLDKTWNVVVAGYTSGGNASANSNAVNLVLAHVAASVAYQSKPALVTVRPATIGLAPALTADVAELYDGDQLLGRGTNTTAGAAVAIALDSPLVPGRAYTVRTAGIITSGDCVRATSTGPFGPHLPVLVGTPTAVSAHFDGAMLVVSWSAVPEPAVQGYTVTLDDGTAFNCGLQTFLAVPYAFKSLSGVTLAVNAFGANTLGPACAPVSVAGPGELPAPDGVAACYDGELLFVDWQPVPVPNVLGYTVILTNGTTSQAIGSGADTKLVFPCVLDLSVKWSVTVATVGYGGTGAAGNGVAVTPPPALVAPGAVCARYDGAELVVGWTMPTLGAVRGFVVTLTDGATPQTINTGPDTTLVLPVVLDVGRSWHVTVAAVGFAGSGPGSAAAPVAGPAALPPPGGISARYDGAILIVDWQALAAPNLLGYAVTVSDGTTPRTIHTGPETTLALPVALDTTKAWNVTIASVGYAGTGQPSAAAAVTGPVALPPPTGLAARYDGVELVADWKPIATPNVLGYTLALTDGASTTTINTGPGTTLALPIVLDLAKSWSVTVATLGYGGVGTPSAAAAVAGPAALPAPEGLSARYDGASLVVGWQPLALPNVLGYVVTLSDGGSSQAIETGAQAMLVLPLVLDLARRWTVTVAAIGHAGTGTPSAAAAVAGPAGLAAPSGLSARYDGVSLVASWQPLAQPNVLGYALTLSDGAASQAIVTGPDTTLVLPIALDLAKPWSMTVAAIGFGGTGAASGAAAVAGPQPLPAPAGLSARYDGIELVADWHPLALPNVLGYMLTLSDGTSTQSLDTGPGTHLAVPLVLDLSKTWTITAAAIGYAGTGAASAAATVALPAITTAPALSALACDAGLLHLRWTPLAVAAVAAYRVTLTADGAVTAVRTADSHLSVPVDPTVSRLSVTVCALGHGFAGPESAPVAAIVSSPATISVTTDAASGAATLAWAGVEAADAYLLCFAPGGKPTRLTGTSYPIPPEAFTPDAPLRLTVAGAASSNGTAITGPSSTQFTLPGSVPDTHGAAYDGVTASVCWQPVPGASGYTITVLATASGTTVAAATAAAPAGARSGGVALAAERGKAYTVVVQARFGAAGTGTPSAALPLFTSAYFASSTAAATAYPFVYPATSLGTVLDPDTAKQGEPVTLYLPELGSGAGASPQLAGLPVTKGAFTLALNPDSATKAAYPYTLTIGNQAAPSSNPWFFGTTPPAVAPSAIRRGVLADYVALLTAAETSGACPAGIGYLQNIVGRCLPQTFAELLYYNYGLTLLDPSAGVTLGSIDVRPGMVLRVANAAYQRVPGESSRDQPLLNGFVGGTVTDYEVGAMNGTDGSWSVGFDAFVGQLVASETLQVLAPPGNRQANTQGGGADAADLCFGTFNGPFYRLFVPSTLAGADGAGSELLSSNFVLASAASYSALCSTTNVLNPDGNNMLAYFRGRSIVKPCIRVSVDGAGMVVPVGTTVGNLLELRGSLPPALKGQALRGISLQRTLGGAVFDPTAVPDAAASYPVRMDWRSAQAALYGPRWDLLAMPLLAGDRIGLAA